MTDDTGQVVDRYSYSAYGEIETLTNGGTKITSNPYFFTGRRFDAELTIYYYRARYHDPALGRFLSRDPLGYVDGMSLYLYTSLNPLNRLDAFGNEDENTFPLPKYRGRPRVSPTSGKTVSCQVYDPKINATIVVELVCVKEEDADEKKYSLKVTYTLSAKNRDIDSGGPNSQGFDNMRGNLSGDPVHHHDTDYGVVGLEEKNGNGPVYTNANKGRGPKDPKTNWKGSGDFENANKDYDDTRNEILEGKENTSALSGIMIWDVQTTLNYPIGTKTKGELRLNFLYSDVWSGGNDSPVNGVTSVAWLGKYDVSWERTGDELKYSVKNAFEVKHAVQNSVAEELLKSPPYLPE